MAVAGNLKKKYAGRERVKW